MDPEFPKDFEYRVIKINDTAFENIMIFLDYGVDFIKGAIDSGQVVYVHCNAGISRSASMVIAYYIREKKMSF